MSVRKRTWTTGKGEQRSAWQVVYTDANGKRRAKTFTHKKLADAFSATARVEVRDGVHVHHRDTITVAAAGALWLLSGEANGLERTTVDQRRQHLKNHIVPMIGGKLLSAITVRAVLEFTDALRLAGRSPALVRKIRVSLGGILADAVSRELCMRNAVREVRGGRSPAGRHKRKLRVGEDIPTPGEIRAFLGALQGRWRALLIVAVFCGLRASELRGLRWTDYSGDAIHIRQRADKHGDIGSPKSAAGSRSVPVPPVLADVLEAWRAVCPPGPLGLMFPNGAGNVEGLSNIVLRGLIPAWEAAGITGRYRGLHALRHWYASWCINRRADGGLELPMKVVQERLGHSTLAMTSDIYGHLFPRGDDGGALADGAAALMGATKT